jgi:hypothetical protein
MNSFKVRIVALAASAALYVGAGLLMWKRDNPHFHLYMLVLAYALLLPACTWVLMKDRGHSADGAPSRWLRARQVVALYVLIAAPLAWYLGKSVYCADESTYLFQAQAILHGHLTADAPPLQSFYLNNPDHLGVFFNHVLDDRKWFGKYPPGWPMLLALGTFLKASWLVAPLLGLLLLWVSLQIPLELFGRDLTTLAATILVLSPYFILNSVGYMPHVFSGVLLALATLALFRGISSGRAQWFIAASIALGCAALVRPFTAACVYPVFAVAGIWALKSNRSALIRVFLSSAVITLGFAGLMGAYNKALTGSWWMATYAYYSGTAVPVEINTNLSLIFHNLSMFTRYGVQETLLSAFPFMFLLAAYAVWREEEHRLQVYVLAALFLALVIGHVVQTDQSNSRVGERYYFDCFFAAAILAARGASLLAARYHFSVRSVAAVATVLLAIQSYHYVLFTDTALRRFRPYLAVESALRQVQLTDAVAFVTSARPEFTSEDLNLNSPDWQSEPVFYIPDPGPQLRAAVVCKLQRSRWMTMRYDRKLGIGVATPSQEVTNCPARVNSPRLRIDSRPQVDLNGAF